MDLQRFLQSRKENWKMRHNKVMQSLTVGETEPSIMSIQIRRGKTHRRDGANTQGGTYKAQFSEQVAAYAKMSTPALEKERDALKARSDDQYQRFARSAASRSASQVAGFLEADAKLKMVNQVLRRRKRK